MTGVVVISGGGTTKRPVETKGDGASELSLLAFILAALRKSMVSCRVERREDVIEIGWPTDVQHITHVTFDRFNGFLGLPDELQVEIPCKVPSASASVFGVSAESMQCCYDRNGNSVPMILLLMQERLYSQGGLQAEGIFRINPENSQEQDLRDQLNRGIVPDDIDVHCLAGLIKTWFRELPSGVLDGLSPDQVLHCNSEDDYIDLVTHLKPTQSALLNWAIHLMADVVQEEDFNKMNARNIAMVFAPNMTQMSDPLTALMHAVQVMNLLKTLITRTLREREESDEGGYDSQEEMDVSCESRGSAPSDDGDEYSSSSSSSPSAVIEECFLRDLDEPTELQSMESSCTTTSSASVSSDSTTLRRRRRRSASETPRTLMEIEDSVLYSSCPLLMSS